MPPVIHRPDLRHLQTLLANPQNTAKALQHQQDGGTSGTIPGTDSDPTVVATTTGRIPIYPPAAQSPNGDQVAGVGHQVLNSDGNPAITLGNLLVTQAGNEYDDRALTFHDADGNIVGWHSPTDGLQSVILTNVQSVNYTFTIRDVSKVVESESSGSVTYTIPTFASAGIPLQAYIEVHQYGAGQITIAGAGGVTVVSPGGVYSTAVQYATIGLRQRKQDVWVLTGDLAAP